MAIYKNEYTKKEDFMMWELHNIRKKMASKKLSALSSNNAAKKIIKKYNLTNLKVVKIN